MAQITGTLKDPLGSAIANAIIRVTADDTNSVLVGISGSVTTSDVGLYDFTLENGTYVLEVLFNKQYIRNAIVLIDGTVPASIDLETLIKDHATFIPNLTDS